MEENGEEEKLGAMGLPKFDRNSCLETILKAVVEQRPDIGLTMNGVATSLEAFEKNGLETLGDAEKLSERQWEELDDEGLMPGTETVLKTILYGGFFPEYATEVASNGEPLDFKARLSRNLTIDPFWEADEIGEPLPSSPHACSVSMPCWEHIVGYEEGDPAVWDALALGYPRFVVHPYIARLFRSCEREFAKYGESCFAFPSKKVAERACNYIRHKNGENTPLRIHEYKETGIWAVIFPSGARDAVLKFWQHFGFVISSRWAEDVLKQHCCEDRIEEFPVVKPCDVRTHTLPESFQRWYTESSEEACEKVSKRQGVLECPDQAKTVLKTRLAEASGAKSIDDVFLYPSGMAAISSGLLAAQATFPSCKSIQLGFPYLDVFKIQTVWGPGAHFISDMNPDWLDQVTNLVKEQQISSVVLEYPGNPLLQVPDILALSALLQEHGVPLIVDDTIGSCANFNMLEHADVVVTSLTKWFCGTGDVMAGSMILKRNSQFFERFKKFTESEFEDNFYHKDAVALEMNSRSFIPRMEKVNETTKPLVEFLRAHPSIEKLWYPDSVNDQSVVKRGHGGLFSFILKDKEKSMDFYRNLRVCKGPSLGTNFTIACPYTLLAHYDELDWAEGLGIPSHLIRVSTGLEEPDDLIQRFGYALDSVE
eukprot:CAMPEP_0114501096 /NCGR_PEP_ID=MMETSP0109-20121206/8316_1 /TAXON_ID=29199 /ORGANISM="Chlorarachnion reptans, Strain CCCM449" /LENGTH=652 /DNA_ID=CAMNT_0001678803 /DNA_START=174 /DNA_END=2132 /DNA_ORIENTATION=-